MRALVQRVTRAEVRSDDEPTGAIELGLAAFVGVTHDDDEAAADRLADKLVHLRVFGDEDGRMNRSVLDVSGAILVVSQFTLYGDTRKGRRPSYVHAAPPEQAEPLVERVASAIADHGVEVATGRFRTHMQVELTNDGPVTLMLET